VFLSFRCFWHTFALLLTVAVSYTMYSMPLVFITSVLYDYTVMFICLLSFYYMLYNIRKINMPLPVDAPTGSVLRIYVITPMSHVHITRSCHMFMPLQVLVKNKQINHAELDFLLRFPLQPNVTSPVDFLSNISWGGIKVCLYCYLMILLLVVTLFEPEDHFA